MDIHQERLIRRAAAGDDGAFEQLMLAQQKQVYNLCLRMSGNPEDAFDLSQEAFLRAWRALARYQFEAEFSTWLFRLTRNVCIDFLRKQKRQPTVPLETEPDGETLELPLPDSAPETMTARKRVFSTLPPAASTAWGLSPQARSRRP